MLLLDRPQQPARLVQARAVGPAVERREALRALPATSPAVGDPVGPGRVPRHPDEQRPIVAVVSRPPILRARHDLEDVALERLHVERLELLLVVEAWAERRGLRGVVVKELQVRLVGPPILVGSRPGALRRWGWDRRVLGLAHGVGHAIPPACSLLVRSRMPPCTAHRADPEEMLTPVGRQRAVAGWTALGTPPRRTPGRPRRRSHRPGRRRAREAGHRV